MSTRDNDRSASTTIRITTKCKSVDEFVMRFAMFVDSDSMFLATASPLPAGTRRRFLVVLAEGTVMLQGLGEVMAGHRRLGERTGMRLRFVEIDAASCAMHGRLIAAKKPRRLGSSPPAGPPPGPAATRALPPPFRRPAPPPPIAPAPPPPIAPAPAPMPVPAAAPVVAIAPAPVVAIAEPAAASAPVIAGVAPARVSRAPSIRRAPFFVPRRRSPRVIAAVGALALLAFIGAAFALGDSAHDEGQGPSAPKTAREAPAAAVAPAPAPPPVAVEPVAVEPPATIEIERAPAAPTAPVAKAGRQPRARVARRPASQARAAAAPGPRQLARLSLSSSPPGAAFVVDGASLDRTNQTAVPSFTTVKVTAVLRGYKRTTQTVYVRTDASVVIPLQRLSW